MNVLIVEDDDLDAEATERMLRRSGEKDLSVTRVDTLVAGLTALQKQPESLVLLDLGLPDSQGLDTVRRVIVTAPKATVIVQTGMADDRMGIDALEAGAQDYLVKGRLEPELLARAMRYARERKSAENKLRGVNEELGKVLEELRETQAQLVGQERLNAIGQMACGIAHDFNNTLTPILGAVDCLIADPGSWSNLEGTRDMLETIRRSAEDASAIVRRFHVFYQPAISPELEESVSVSQLLRDAAEYGGNQVVEQGKPGIKVRANELPGISIRGIKRELDQVLQNLVLNAVEAIPETGVIRLEATVEGDRVVLLVEDDGPGMPDAIANHCFEPFVSAKGDAGAKGLGLTMVYGAVQHQHGSIEVSSGEGGGTRFTIRLPATEPGGAATAEAAASKILFVDDDEPIRQIAEKMLNLEKQPVTMCASAEEAWDRFREEDFELVITDWSMPGMSGGELAHRIRQTKPDQRVILMTGFGDAVYQQGSEPPEVERVIAKPLRMATLRKLLEPR